MKTLVIRSIIVLIFVVNSAYCLLNIETLPVLKITPGKAASLNFADYVTVTGEDKKFEVRVLPRKNNKKVKINYNSSSGKLDFSASNDFTGIEIVRLHVSNSQKESQDAALIIMADRKKTVTFYCKPASLAKKVSVSGEFNGWNQSSNPLAKNEESGIYTTSIELLPGSYQYKFVVDGNWIQDPQNPEKAPDGFGGFNSIIKVDGEKKESGEFVGISRKKDPKTGKKIIIIKYIGKENGKKIPLDITTLIVLMDNKVLTGREYEYDMASARVIINPPVTDSRHWFRVFASDRNGNAVKPFYFVDDNGKNNNWCDRVIYMVMVDRFHNGDKSNDIPVSDKEVEPQLNYQGGDLKGITEKIKSGYFDSMGVNAIWLSPVVDNPDTAYREGVPPYKKYTGYHGYWPVSMTKIEERFGSMSDLKELVSEAHKRDIKILLDVVINQIHRENSLYKEHPEWFGTFILPDGRKNLRLFDERPLDTWFDEFLPDVDYQKNPDAVRYFTDNCIWWIEQSNCDGFRLDAVKHVPVNFWKELKRKIKEKIEIPHGKKFYLLGESITSRDKIMEYIGPSMLDGQFDFPLYWAIKDTFGGKGSFENLEKERKKSEEEFFVPGVIISPLMGNHDFLRFIKSSDYNRMNMAFAFLLTLPGAPMIYYGDEICLSEGNPPDNRRKMRFEGELTTEESRTLNFFSTVAKVRKEHPAARHGRHTVIEIDEDTYVYIKQYFDDFVVVGMNLSSSVKEVSVELPEYLRFKKEFKNVFTFKKTSVKGGKFNIKIQPSGCVVLTG
ncbi:MAG: alpha-amylase family glycosyl hydrolase [Elusimicrobiota bacterium]